MQVDFKVLVCLAVVFITVALGFGQQSVASPSTPQSLYAEGHYFSQDLLLVSTSEGLLQATNEGWRQIYPDAVQPLVSLGGAIYLYRHATYEIRRSLDGGETWSLAGTFPFTDTITGEFLSASPITDTVFMGVSYSFPETGPLKGIYKSTDGGVVWRKVLDGYSASRITFSPNFAQDGIAFTEFGSYKTTFGVWKTEDWGETWFHSSEGLPVGGTLTGHVISISPQFAQDQTVFAISDYGVYKSMHGGESWFGVGNPPGYFPNKIAVSPNYIHDQTLLTGDYNEGLFLSQDGGESWQPIDFDVSPRHVGIRLVGPFRSWPEPPPPDPPGPYRVYFPIVATGISSPGLELWVVEYNGPDPCRLYRSQDYGITWEEVQVFEQSYWLYLPLVAHASVEE